MQDVRLGLCSGQRPQVARLLHLGRQLPQRGIAEQHAQPRLPGEADAQPRLLTRRHFGDLDQPAQRRGPEVLCLVDDQQRRPLAERTEERLQLRLRRAARHRIGGERVGDETQQVVGVELGVGNLADHDAAGFGLGEPGAQHGGLAGADFAAQHDEGPFLREGRSERRQRDAVLLAVEEEVRVRRQLERGAGDAEILLIHRRSRHAFRVPRRVCPSV